MPCPARAVYTCVATSGAQREEAQTRVLPQEPEDREGQWEELTLVEEEEKVGKEEIL